MATTPRRPSTSTSPPTSRASRRTLRHAIDEALAHAGPLPYPAPRRAVALGTTLHGMRAGGRFLRSGDPADLRPFLAGATLRAAPPRPRLRRRTTHHLQCLLQQPRQRRPRP